MSVQTDKRNPLLDYVRAIACIFIVLYHYTQRYTELYGVGAEWPFKLTCGYMAISTFFMLSGYLSVRGNEGKGLLHYIKKKVVRLYPEYWVSIVITFVVTSLFLPSRAVSTGEMLFNLTMLESFVGVNLVDGAYWTLANELILYAFIAIAVVALKKKDKLPFFCTVWLVLLFLFSFFESDSLIYAAFGKLIANKYGHMFVLGICLYYLDQKTFGKKERILSGINIILSCVYQYYVYDFCYFVFFMVSALVIGSCIYTGSKGTQNSQKARSILKPLQTLASISYPLYLVHQNVGYAILNMLIRNSEVSEVIVLVPIGITILIAYVIHRFVGIPINRIMTD